MLSKIHPINTSWSLGVNRCRLDQNTIQILQSVSCIGIPLKSDNLPIKAQKEVILGDYVHKMEDVGKTNHAMF